MLVTCTSVVARPFADYDQLPGRNPIHAGADVQRRIDVDVVDVTAVTATLLKVLSTVQDGDHVGGERR